MFLHRLRYLVKSHVLIFEIERNGNVQVKYKYLNIFKSTLLE